MHPAHFALAASILLAGTVHAEDLRASLHLIDAHGILGPAGEILLADSPDGARLLVELRHMPPGSYRLQIHRGASCDPGPDDAGEMAAGVLAGEPWAPADGPGDVGMVADQPPPGPDASTTPPDLPPLEVDADGHAYREIIVAEIPDVNVLWYRSFVLHDPEGRRIACGIVG
ncbi:MAG: superoxide dismutase family protein [Geminicoccaceae bacterium]